MAAEKFSPPWQSFVDCLSTVLLIMVFFSIVLVILVSVLSYSISKKEMSQMRSTAEHTGAEDVTTEEKELTHASVDIEAFMTKGESRFIIYYDGLLSEATSDIMEEFQAWITKIDPNNLKTIKIVQEVAINGVSISDRRLTGFKRYYALSRFIKEKVGNKNVIKSFSVTRGDKPQNRAIITFE